MNNQDLIERMMNESLKPQSNLQNEAILEHFVSENDLFVEPYKEPWKKILGTAFYAVQLVAGFVLLTFIRYESEYGYYCTALNQLTSWKYLLVSTYIAYIFNCIRYRQRGNRLRESLPTFITLHKARAVYHWEVVADTKLFQDSSLGNSVCTYL